MFIVNVETGNWEGMNIRWDFGNEVPKVKYGYNHPNIFLTFSYSG